MLSQRCQGLRSRLLHHPPSVTFLACIVILAAALLSLGAYLQTHPVTDADFTQDWDSFLHVLSTKKLCPPGDVTGHTSASLAAEERDNVSVVAAITLSPWQGALNYSSLRITATATQLGLNGVDADTPLTVTLTPDWSSIQCNGRSSDCFLKCCILITGPHHLLPQSRLSPRCAVSNSSIPVLPDLYVAETEPSNSSSCYSLAYHGEPSLKNILSEADIALCVQRLNYTGLAVLLLGLVLMMIFACCTPPIKETRPHGAL